MPDISRSAVERTRRASSFFQSLRSRNGNREYRSETVPVVMKRGLDILVAACGLALLSPLFLIVALAIKADSAGPVLFRQERIGKGFAPFWMYKFRTMVKDATKRGGLLTSACDARITSVGRILRKTKVDELPQLINVLKGDMSLVGPLRPEVLQFVELYRCDYAPLLSVAPGITDMASLKYSDEQALLAKFENPEEEYILRLLPEKIHLGKQYLRQSSFIFDLALIGKTLFVLVTRKNPWIDGIPLSTGRT